MVSDILFDTIRGVARGAEGVVGSTHEATVRRRASVGLRAAVLGPSSRLAASSITASEWYVYTYIDTHLFSRRVRQSLNGSHNSRNIDMTSAELITAISSSSNTKTS